MTDEEVICTWMEPKPTKSIIDIVRDNEPAPGKWWNDRHPASAEWRPRTLDLNALWEVEERLTNQQADAYGLSLIGEVADYTTPGARIRTWHATPAQKIKALAAVLRPLVEK